METFRIYCGGEFVETANRLKVMNPFTGECFAETFMAGDAEYEKVVNIAIQAETAMRKLASFEKYEILSDIAQRMKANAERFAEMICKEAGKPIKYAKVEVNRAIQVFIVAAEEAKRLPKEYISLDWTPAGTNKEGLVKYFPVGTVAAISPFNFPLNLAVHKVGPAIAAGCPVILKPSSATPISALLLAEIIDKTKLPKGAFSVLPMERKVANRLVTDDRIKLLTFTGSPTVGWQMKKDAGKKKVVLELGGNAGAIVTESCDIDNAIKKCIIGGFAYSGQVCIHLQRIFIDRKLFGYFSERYGEMAKALKYGDPIEQTTDVSVMIDEENAIRVEDWVNEAIREGANVLCGGKRKGLFYEPTVITDTNNRMKVNSHEIFGPIVTIEPYDDFKEAVDRINDSKYGLQAAVFTNDMREVNYAFENINTGGVIINDSSAFRVDHMPYGGIKDSGLGREGVKYAIAEMMEAKILVINN